MVASAAKKREKVTIYVEGGPKGKDSRSQISVLRESIKQLLEKAGFAGQLPKTVPCGPRDQAYKSFCNHIRNRDEGIPLLLVDSEDVVASQFDLTFQDDFVWDHVKNREGDEWARPKGAQNDQLAFMATSMETWLIADIGCLKEYFGQGFDAKKLPTSNLEQKDRKMVLRALEDATKVCKHQYGKGDDGLKLIGMVDPNVLRVKLPHFERFEKMLKRHL